MSLLTIEVKCCCCYLLYEAALCIIGCFYSLSTRRTSMFSYGNLNCHQIVPHVPGKTWLSHWKHCFGASSELLIHALHEIQWVQSLFPFYWYLIFEAEQNKTFEVSLSQTKECSLGTAIKCCGFACDSIINNILLVQRVWKDGKGELHLFLVHWLITLKNSKSLLLWKLS